MYKYIYNLFVLVFCLGTYYKMISLRSAKKTCFPLNKAKYLIDMYTLLYLKWITNKDLLYSTGNSAQHSVTN